ncbi:MAG: SpoIIE family protein phosphatase [Spirochaetes bacterium]|nr:SpoIIE family protein phosphatase [Spirochaetota bacterium]
MPSSIKTVPIVLLMVLLVLACAPTRHHRPGAADGVLDLAGYSLERNGPVALDGEWEFYWKRFIDPLSFQGPEPPLPDNFIGVPRFWDGHRVGSRTIGATGFATYRLTIKNCSYRGVAGIKFSETSTAFRLYVNGAEIYACGRPGEDRESAVPRWLGDTAYFKSAADTVDIVVHVSNYHYIRGGLFKSVKLGTADEIKSAHEMSSWIDFFIFGSLCIMGLYNLGLAALRRKDRSPLYFGISCLLIALRSLSSGEHYLTHLLPLASWELLHKIEVLSFTALIPVFMMYLQSLFPDRFHRRVIILSAAVSGVISLIVLATPSTVYSRTALFFQVFTIAMMVYGIVMLIGAARRHREGSAIILTGFMLLALSAINDILYDRSIIQTAYLSHIGLFVFIFSQGYLLLARFSNSFDRIEKLTDDLQRSFKEIENKNISLISANRELEELKNGLEKIVEERTDELHSALAEMEQMNDQLITTNRSLKEAHKAAEADMKMAANVQTAVILKDPPRIDGWDIACRYIPMAGVSGDFYDFYKFGDSLTGVGLFDVSGHGISSGLITMTAKTILFRLFREYHDKNFSQTFTRFNMELHREIGQAYYYLTGVLLKISGGDVEYLNAAHIDILVKGNGGVHPVRHDNGEENNGFLLGIMPDEHQYPMIPFTVAPGEVIAIFTDGLIEAHKIELETYGMKRLMASLESAPDGSAREILDRLLRDLYSFTGEDRLTDDLTLIIMKRESK